MVLTMYLCVPFVKALQYRWYTYHWTGVVIQHTFQSLYLAAAVWWGYHRQWYWVQSGFLVLREWGTDAVALRGLTPRDGLLTHLRLPVQLDEGAPNLQTSLPTLRYHRPVPDHR